MFQTEPILWLQSFRGNELTLFMRGASMLVNDAVFLALGLILFFCIDHRKVYAALVTLLWVAMLTAVLKSWFALPRPSDVDMRVLMLETGTPNGTPFFAHGAIWFFGLPSDDAINYVRALPSHDYGLPSGHCSSTVAFWGTLALLFRKRSTVILALALAALMPISRMYLGRHFMGDTVAGFLIGGVALVSVIAVERTFHARHPGGIASLTPSQLNIFHVIGLIVLPVLLLLSGVTRVYAAPLFALGLVYFATGRLAIYDHNTTVLSRILTTISALAILAGLLMGLQGLLPRSLLYAFVVVCVFGCTAIGLGLGKPGNMFTQNT